MTWRALFIFPYATGAEGAVTRQLTKELSEVCKRAALTELCCRVVETVLREFVPRHYHLREPFVVWAHRALLRQEDFARMPRRLLLQAMMLALVGPNR